MARLKFFLFAIVVLALGLGHLFFVAEAFHRAVLASASAQAAVGSAQLSPALSAQAAQLQSVALSLAGGAELNAAVQAVKGGKLTDPSTAPRLNALRAAAQKVVPAALRDEWVVALAAEGGAIYLKGDSAPSTEGLDVQALATVGPAGGLREAFGTPYVFVALPLANVAEKPESESEPRAPLSVVFGTPLKLAPHADGQPAWALVSGEKVVASTGPESGPVLQALVKLNNGQTAVVERGAVRKVGPLQLPLFTRSNDLRGGNAPLTVGTRQALEATPYELVTLVSVRAQADALAQYQLRALAAWIGLALLSLFTWAVLGSSSQPRVSSQPNVSMGSPPRANTARFESSLAPLPIAEAPPAPEATADDFPFSAAPAPFAPPESPRTPPPSPAAPGGFPFPPAPSPLEAFPQGAPATDYSQTAPYTLPPEGDPFLQSLGNAPLSYEDEPGEATRVASIPQELLQQSVGPAAAETRAYSLPSAQPPPPKVAHSSVSVFAGPSSNAVVAEEQHFQDVFRDFVATRERCGEPADGLTFDKFAVKLRKNREQLVQKYSCRTVRFQVYIKEGKAALKATPVKD